MPKLPENTPNKRKLFPSLFIAHYLLAGPHSPIHPPSLGDPATPTDTSHSLFWRLRSRCASRSLPTLSRLLQLNKATGVGGGGGGGSFQPFGFPEVGTISFPAPLRRLSVPPLAGLEGQGCGALGCRGAAGGLLSALPQHSSSFQCSHPNAFFQPHLHQGGCSGGGHLGLHCQGCCGASSTHFPRLLQPSVRSVADLGVMASGHRPFPSHSLCGRVSLPDGDHSVCAPVGTSGGLDGLHPSNGSVPSSAGSSSFSSLSSLHVRAVLWPLHGSAGLHQGLGSCFCYTPFYGIPYKTLSRRLASPVNLSGVPPRGSSDCPPTLSRVGGLWSTPRIPTWFHHWWFSIWGLSLTPPLSGLLRRRSASPGCSRQPQSFSPAPRLPRAYGYRYSASILR